jgi:hypothetical protein
MEDRGWRIGDRTAIFGATFDPRSSIPYPLSPIPYPLSPIPYPLSPIFDPSRPELYLQPPGLAVRLQILANPAK